MKHLTAQPEVDELPEPFPRVIRKALAKDPDDRYQTVTEMMAEVFAVERINQSIASMDSLSLTRMAAAVAAKVKVGAGGGGRLGAGSSSVPTLAATPPIVEHDYAAGAEGRGVHMGPPPIPGARRPDDDQHGVALRRGAFSKATWFPQRHRLTTGLLGVLLGPLGVHRFYTGYTSVGVWQIILSIFTGGIAGIWGFIEGVRILSGFDYRDALGRSLLNERPVSPPVLELRNAVAGLVDDAADAVGRRGARNAANRDPAQRSKFGKIAWTMMGVLFTLGSAGLFIGATFAPAEYQQVGWSAEGQAYYFNMFHLMYFFGSVALGIGAFAIWKGMHRSGLSSYQATIRPGLMCFCAATAGVSLAMSRYLFAGRAQLGALIALAFAAFGFLSMWLLRGPDLVRQPVDPYWGPALARGLLVIAIVAAIASVALCIRWDDQGGQFYMSSAPTFQSVTVHRAYWNGGSYADSEWKSRTMSVPGAKYNYLPIAAGLLAVLAVGFFSESFYRRRLARSPGPADIEAAS